MKKLLQSKYFNSFAVMVLMVFIVLGGYGGCNSNNGAGDGGGGDTSEVTTTLCGSIDQEQDSGFIDCGASISVINNLGLATTSQRALGNPLGTAYLNIPFIDTVENRNFVNAAIDFNEDGNIADYDTANGTQKEWIVVNNPAIIFPFDYNFYFNITDDSVDTGIAYNLIIMLSDNTIESASEFNGTIPQDVSYIEGSIGLSVFDFVNMVDPDPEAFGSGEFNGNNALTPSDIGSSRGTEIISVDGVDIVILDGVPDLPQSVNTCVPNSIVNSIAWLADTFDFDLMIDDGEGGKFSVDLTNLESIGNDLLAPYIDHVTNSGGFLLENGQIKGVTGEKIVPLKNSFVENNNIPIKTTEININPENPGDLIETLKDRLEEGCIAELKFQLFNAQGQKLGGHVVTMTGYSLGSAFDKVDEFGDPLPGDSSSTRQIVVHDANHTVFDKETFEVIPQNDVYNYDINSNGEILIQNYTYGLEGTATVKLVGAIVECIDLDSDDTNFSFTAIPDGELSIIHKKFVDNCPQPIGTITVTNNGNVPFDWFRLGLAGTRTTPTAGTLQPGESVVLMVEFTCNPPSDIMGNIRIKAVVGQTEMEISIPVSVDVQQ